MLQRIMINNFSNSDISSLFSNMAVSLTLQDEKKNFFRILAYKKAAESISSLSQDVRDLWKENKIDEVPGIGKSMMEHLTNLFTKGKDVELRKQIDKYPESVYILQKMRGIGPKTALALAKLIGKKSNKGDKGNKGDFEKIIIDKVIQLCKEHKISKMEGFGEKSENEILAAVLKFKEGFKKDARILLSRAMEVAENFIGYMKQCKDVSKIEVLGSLRRKLETIGDIDIAVSSDNLENVINHFVNYRYTKSVTEKGENKASIEIANGIHVDLRVINPDQWGTMLAHFTGSKEHNVSLREYTLKNGLSISEYGIKLNNSHVGTNLPVCPMGTTRRSSPTEKTKIKTFETEKEFYDFLGLQSIPPEIRENTGEVEAALNHKLPKLVELKNIKGDLHLHTNFDIRTSHDLGESTPEEIIARAIKLNYKYIAFSEHNPSMSRNSKIQKSEILKRKQDLVNRLNQKYRENMHIFNSLEVDILPNGEMAIEDEHLQYLDFIIASIHSSFEQDRDKQTERILKALEFPKVKIFGHPTGRLVGKRSSIDFDTNAVFEKCNLKRIAIEISASPYRQDPPWAMIKELQSNNNLFIINTDSHEVSEMDNMKFGVWNARKGWLEAKHVLNAWELNEVKRFLLR